MLGYQPPAAPPPSPRPPAALEAFATAPTEAGGQSAPFPARQEPDLSEIPDARPSDGWEQGDLVGEEAAPAWTDRPSKGLAGAGRAQEPAFTEGRSARSGSIDTSLDDDEDEEPGGRSLRVTVPLVLIGLVVVGAAGVWLLRPDLFESWAGQLVSSEQEEGVSQAYLRGREYFLLDTNEGFEQADREFHRGGENDGLTRAGLAEAYTAWSQYYLDEVADNRLRAKTAVPTEAAALKARADIWQDEFHQKLEQARRFVDGALKHAPNTAEAHRAAADYYRLAGELDKARSHADRALAMARDAPDALPETEYVSALVDLTAGGETPEAIGRLRAVVTRNVKLIRCHYRLARLLAARGERTDALDSLSHVIELNPDHERAQKLRSALRAAEPLVVAVASATISPAAGAEDADAGAEAGAADGGALLASTDGGAPDAPAASSTGDEGPVAVAGTESADALIQRASKLQRSGSRQACTLV